MTTPKAMTKWPVITLIALTGAAASGANLTMDSARGEQLFSTLSCIQCHSVHGEGGKVGPDLGDRLDRDFTPAQLASTMWNHAPAMWSALGGREVNAGDLNEQAAADLFAYFYAARFFERPGDGGRGKALFTLAHCADCHGLTQAKIPAAKPVSQWESRDRPVELVTVMWNHAATMKQEFAKRKIGWPELSSQDFADISVYVRHLPGTPRRPDLLVLTSGENGKALFDSKGCAACHTGKHELGSRLGGQTLMDIAVDMWNHAPKMAAAAPALDVSEMRDLTSYLWAQQFFLDSGNAAAGKRVFTAKHCDSCHGDASGAAPKLAADGPVTASAMVSALWRHGPQMLDQMRAKNVPWPRFDGAEMANLIAYLNASGGKTNSGKQ